MGKSGKPRCWLDSGVPDSWTLALVSATLVSGSGTAASAPEMQLWLRCGTPGCGMQGARGKASSGAAWTVSGATRKLK